MNYSYGIRLSILSIIVIGTLSGCSGSGNDEPTSVEVLTLNPPLITQIDPDSIIPGDTLEITGQNFGRRQGGSALVIGGKSALQVLIWSDTLINVIVPDGAISGTVSITAGGRTSNAVAINILPLPVQYSYLAHVRPILLVNNCILCHGGSGGLDVGTVGQLLSGGADGPAIIPGNADSSLLVRKLLPGPPFGDQMPPNGPYLSDSLVLIIKTWINQGAKDN